MQVQQQRSFLELVATVFLHVGRKAGQVKVLARHCEVERDVLGQRVHRAGDGEGRKVAQPPRQLYGGRPFVIGGEAFHVAADFRHVQRAVRLD